jgi:hypothetical protein
MSEEVTQQEQLVETPQVESQPTQPSAPDLNINDLITLRNIFEVVTQRGTFKAAELEAVGKAFNKLNAFLEAVTKKEE